MSGFWQDLRYALRGLRKSPGFTIAAVLTLMLGLGANTAIFALWSGVLYAPLPGVDRPEELVMVSDPGASGMLRGRDSGTRRWFTYSEFEHLQAHATGFSGLMASQSSLNVWHVRVEGNASEEMRGRLVSGRFFDILGVRPAFGRLFTASEDRGQPAVAVISHAFWQRRFGGRHDVLGEALTIRETPVSVIGVAPAGFIGETNGERPDVWLPLQLQPRILPGGDWLHEQPPDKVMWLHVFGRLKEGVTPAGAEAQANAVFQSGLESFYGPNQRQEFADQRLLLQSAARGASASRDELASLLSVLFASAGGLLLIACANLTNLLLVRGAARQTEIELRLSLGASRAQLVRQLTTESVTLAAIGGVGALAVAYVMHDVLLRLLQQSQSHFDIAFDLSVPVVAFTVTATFVCAVVLGALPAWQSTRANHGSSFGAGGRGTIGSFKEARAGRWLVVVQLALSLPLLVGAGLLAQTVYNLQTSDLGFGVERLLVARVNLGPIVNDVAQRDRVLRELLGRIKAIPGVDAASFSQLGLFGGGFSTADIEVAGGAAPVRRAESGLDRVGAGYFTTLRIPILRGRDIVEADRADSQKVCVVNEAFVQQYFGGRDPLGMRVTTVDDGARVGYEIVGVVRNARTRSVRGEVEPRFFVPAEQRPSLGTGRTFLIRTAPGTGRFPIAVREAMNGIAPGLSGSDLELATIEEHMAPLTASEKFTARLGVAFGTVALILAAVGLYGVLSYGVMRRSREIAVRIALGAQAGGIVSMILRETSGLVLGGLLAGSVLAYAASRAIAAQLYGVTAHDPVTLALAMSTLIFVAFVAAYLPAHRAAHVDPLVVMRYE